LDGERLYQALLDKERLDEKRSGKEDLGRITEENEPDESLREEDGSSHGSRVEAGKPEFQRMNDTLSSKSPNRKSQKSKSPKFGKKLYKKNSKKNKSSKSLKSPKSPKSPKSLKSSKSPKSPKSPKGKSPQLSNILAKSPKSSKSPKSPRLPSNTRVPKIPKLPKKSNLRLGPFSPFDEKSLYAPKSYKDAMAAVATMTEKAENSNKSNKAVKPPKSKKKNKMMLTKSKTGTYGKSQTNDTDMRITKTTMHTGRVLDSEDSNSIKWRTKHGASVTQNNFDVMSSHDGTNDGFTKKLEKTEEVKSPTNLKASNRKKSTKRKKSPKSKAQKSPKPKAQKSPKPEAQKSPKPEAQESPRPKAQKSTISQRLKINKKKTVPKTNLTSVVSPTGRKKLKADKSRSVFEQFRRINKSKARGVRREIKETFTSQLDSPRSKKRNLNPKDEEKDLHETETNMLTENIEDPDLISTPREFLAESNDVDFNYDFESDSDIEQAPRCKKRIEDEEDIRALEKDHPNVLEDVQEHTLFLLRAIFDAFDEKGDKITKYFRQNRVSKCLQVKAVEIIDCPSELFRELGGDTHSMILSTSHIDSLKNNLTIIEGDNENLTISENDIQHFEDKGLYDLDRHGELDALMKMNKFGDLEYDPNGRGYGANDSM
jgi:hypothetical protein